MKIRYIIQLSRARSKAFDGITQKEMLDNEFSNSKEKISISTMRDSILVFYIKIQNSMGIFTSKLFADKEHNITTGLGLYNNNAYHIHHAIEKPNELTPGCLISTGYGKGTQLFIKKIQFGIFGMVYCCLSQPDNYKIYFGPGEIDPKLKNILTTHYENFYKVERIKQNKDLNSIEKQF